MHKTAFTLIEIMIGILIVSIVMIGGFSALSAVTVGKVRLIEKTNIEKEAFYFSEKLFETIKKGGTLDYEEYWNRKAVNFLPGSNYGSGHFIKPTGFGNYGEGGSGLSYGNGFYYCLSGDGVAMGTDGCLEGNNIDNLAGVVRNTYSYQEIPQRYGQYELQFIDLNINADDDFNANLTPPRDTPGDEDSDGSIFGDDDDEILGQGPSVFTSGSEITELYLISGDKKKRTLFRWHVINDPDFPGTNGCDFTNPQTPTGSGCLGTIQFLQLEGEDRGHDHDISSPTSDLDGTQYDGIIDTWLISDKFDSTQPIADDTDIDAYWTNLFPSTIHVSDFKIYGFPYKDRELAWKEDNPEINISPYVRLTLKLTPSWKKRKLIRGKLPALDLSTTISLSELYSR